MVPRSGAVSLICPADLAALAARAAQAAPAAPKTRVALELHAVEPDSVEPEVWRAAQRDSGVVALARTREEAARLRAAGADRVVVADGPCAVLGEQIARAAREAGAEARDRRQRVAHLSQLVEDVRSGTAEPRALLAGIGLALLEHPLQVLTEGSNAQSGTSPYRAPEVLNALRTSVQVMARVHALQASARSDGVSDVAALAREVAPMLRIAFGGDVRIRVVTQGGPFMAALPDWCMAVILLSVGVALASSARSQSAKRDSDAELDRDENGAPTSTLSHISGDPLPGQSLVLVDVIGARDLITLEVSTDVTDPEALPEGLVVSDLAASGDPARAALALAAQCLDACDGSIHVDSGWHGGSIVTAFIPGPSTRD